MNQNEFFNRGVGPVYYVTAPTPGGLPERPVRIDPRTGEVTFTDGTPVRDRFLLADSSFEPDGEALATDEGWGFTLWRVRAPLVSAVRVDGLYPNDTWSGETVTYTRRRCRAGLAHGSAVERPEPLRRAADRRRTLERAGRRPGEGRPVRASTSARADRSGAGTSECRVVYTVDADGCSGRDHGRCEPRPAGARRALRPLLLRTSAVRIAFDVSPLSHPLLGIGNYIQGSLAGLAEAAAGRHEIVAFAPTSIRGP